MPIILAVNVLGLVLLTVLSVPSPGADAECCPPGGNDAAPVEACRDADAVPGDGGSEAPCSSTGGCCAVCVSCCKRAACTSHAFRPDEGRAGGPLRPEASPHAGTDPVAAVWHPPRG